MMSEEWIKVEDRLPDSKIERFWGGPEGSHGCLVLNRLHDYSYECVYFNDDDQKFWKKGKVVNVKHWLYVDPRLPHPPQDKASVDELIADSSCFSEILHSDGYLVEASNMEKLAQALQQMQTELSDLKHDITKAQEANTGLVNQLDMAVHTINAASLELGIKQDNEASPVNNARDTLNEFLGKLDKAEWLL